MIDPSYDSMVLGKTTIIGSKKILPVSPLKQEGIGGSSYPLSKQTIVKRAIDYGTFLGVGPVITHLEPPAQCGAEAMLDTEAWIVDDIINARRIEIAP
jgi:hypothetical protein